MNQMTSLIEAKTHGEVDLTASHYIIQERKLLYDLQRKESVIQKSEHCLHSYKRPRN